MSHRTPNHLLATPVKFIFCVLSPLYKIGGGGYIVETLTISHKYKMLVGVKLIPIFVRMRHLLQKMKMQAHRRGDTHINVMAISQT